MSKARHRGPVHLGLRQLLIDWGSALWTGLVTRRRVYGASPAEICHVGLTMADALTAATTNYPVQEPCAWGLSAGACVMWHPSDHVSRYAPVSSATTAL